MAKGFWELWREAAPAPPEIQDMAKRAFDFLGITGIYWEAKIFTNGMENSPDTDAFLASPHGNEAFLLVNLSSPRLDGPGGDRHLAASILHEVLHVFYWDVDLSLEELEGDAYTVLHSMYHSKLDRLARVLLYKVYPELEEKKENEKVARKSGARTGTRRKPRKRGRSR
jgi:hypothetical protein